MADENRRGIAGGVASPQSTCPRDQTDRSHHGQACHHMHQAKDSPSSYPDTMNLMVRAIPPWLPSVGDRDVRVLTTSHRPDRATTGGCPYDFCLSGSLRSGARSQTPVWETHLQDKLSLPSARDTQNRSFAGTPVPKPKFGNDIPDFSKLLAFHHPLVQPLRSEAESFQLCIDHLGKRQVSTMPSRVARSLPLPGFHCQFSLLGDPHTWHLNIFYLCSLDGNFIPLLHGECLAQYSDEYKFLPAVSFQSTV